MQSNLTNDDPVSAGRVEVFRRAMRAPEPGVRP